MQTQLSPSPLEIVRHEFADIHLSSSALENCDAPLSLSFENEWGSSSDDPADWQLILTVRFGGADEDDDSVPYRGMLKIVGFFRINEAYPAEGRNDLIRVTGASILYGACREMLANLTARAPHGMISLPSVSFVQPKKKKTVKKKTARRKVKKAATKSVKRQVGKVGAARKK